jgi:dolichyl-phosphate-mannose-protein mannosyltransferase
MSRLPSGDQLARPPGERAIRTIQAMAVVLLLAAISAAAVGWCTRHGYTLYYGDAEAHLNIARRVLDSRTPGPEQFGTVWLPLPHALMIPFVMRDGWWRSGLAGAIPSAACFVIAGAFLFAAARRIYASAAAGLSVALLFALNPNMLYLQSTPMTEPVFAAALAALLWATLWFRDSQSAWAILAAAVASNAASLTRYEGWFLVPFVALYLLVVARNKSLAMVFGGLALLGPVAWLAHNQYYYGNPWEFYNGYYSAQAIYRRQLAQGIARYPGDHEWRKAFEYYFAAMRLTDGPALLMAGTAGALVALYRRIWWPLAVLALPPVFYVCSIYSSGTPLYVPHLWPNAWYNTRYGLAALPLAALAAGALVTMIPSGLRAAAVLVLAGGASAALAFMGEPACWKEAEVNSIARRAWTHESALFLAAHYRPGSGVIYSFGDLAAVLREAGIPLREGLHQGNHPYWEAATERPEFFLREEWALAVSGDAVATAILRAARHGPHYELQRRIIVKGAPVIEIYQRHLTTPPYWITTQ